MAKFRIDSIADLARQMTFTPHETRAQQVVSAEGLLHDIDPARAYPLDFIIFRITGYHPRKVDDSLLTGMALQHDLGLLIERVSETLDLAIARIAEPVMSIEEVTERFNVTSKTIQRWRRKGLPARRFVFGDGKRRVGFLLSSVERFFASHRRQVTRGTNLSLVDSTEVGEIVRRARVLALAGQAVSQITRRIGRKLNRSPAMVLQILRKADADYPEQAILPLAAPEISADRAAKVLRDLKHGLGLLAAAKAAGISRASAYRLVVDEKVARLSRRRVKFIDDELYHQPDAERVLDQLAGQDTLDAGLDNAERASAEPTAPREVSPYLAALWRTPILSPSRERALFLQFNHHKFRFVVARRSFEPELAKARDLARLDRLWHRAIEVKNQIVRANLRLVASIARKHVRADLDLMELISEGNITLMRAVESFDVHQGNRFSTYATFALLKGYARVVPEMLAAARAGANGATELSDLADLRSSGVGRHAGDREEVRLLLSRLDEREQAVIRSRFGLEEARSSENDLGATLGVSRHRLRQIERRAIEKMRRV